MFEEPANKMDTVVRRLQAIAAGLLADGPSRRIEQVLAGSAVGKRHIVMGAGAKVVAVGLRHETGDGAKRTRDAFHHEAKKREPVGGRQRIGISEVDFELPMATLLVIRLLRICSTNADEPGWDAAT